MAGADDRGRRGRAAAVVPHLSLEIDVRRDVSRSSLAMTALIGLVLGVGWAYLAGTVFADVYDVALGSEANAGPTLWYGLAASIGEALLMLVPAALVRVVSRSTRESLVGFLIGSFGATAFTAAATLTLLAPQLATGPVAADRSLGGLVVEAGYPGCGHAVGQCRRRWHLRCRPVVSPPGRRVAPAVRARGGGRCGRQRALRRTRAVGRLAFPEQRVRRRLPVDRAVGVAPIEDRGAGDAAPRGARRHRSRRANALRGLRSRCRADGVLPELRGVHRHGAETLAARHAGSLARWPRSLARWRWRSWRRC